MATSKTITHPPFFRREKMPEAQPVSLNDPGRDFDANRRTLGCIRKMLFAGKLRKFEKIRKRIEHDYRQNLKD